MYPVAEFRRVARLAVLFGSLTVMGAVLTVFLFVATALHLAEQGGHHHLARRLALVWGTLVAAGLTLLFEVRRKLARHPFTRCPHCRRRLTDTVPQVVACGCCPWCGLRVLEPPAEDPPPDALIPRPDFLAADTAYQTRTVPIVVGGLIACYAGCAGAVAVLDAFDLQFPLNVVVFVLLVSVAPVSLAGVLKWLVAGGKRNPSLTCPTCGQLLAGGRMLVAATGCCFHCGGRAIVPRTRPLPPPHLGPMWTVEGITARLKERRRRYWWYFKKRPLVWITPLVAGYLVGWAVFGSLTAYFQSLARGVQVFSPREVETYSAVAGFLSLFVVGTHAVRWVMKQSHRRHPLACPRCGREFLPAFARGTKCCNRCGWRVVADGGPGSRCAS